MSSVRVTSLTHLHRSLLDMNNSAGLSNSLSGFASFAVSIDCTDEGIKRVDEVVAIVYEYLAMLRQAGPQVGYELASQPTPSSPHHVRCCRRRHRSCTHVGVDLHRDPRDRGHELSVQV